jgi:hypothetical protein
MRAISRVTLDETHVTFMRTKFYEFQELNKKRGLSSSLASASVRRKGPCLAMAAPAHSRRDPISASSLNLKERFCRYHTLSESPDRYTSRVAFCG